MAKRNGYIVATFDIDGSEILSERATTLMAARKLAREFLGYCNVRTVDVTRAEYGDCGTLVERYVRLDAGTSVCIADGQVRNIRF